MKNKIYFKHIKDDSNNNLNNIIDDLYHSAYGQYWIFLANDLIKVKQYEK